MPSLRHSRPQAIEALYRTIVRHPLDRSLALMHHVRSEERVLDFTLEEIDYVLARIRRNLSRLTRQNPVPPVHQPAQNVNQRWISDITLLSHRHHLSLSYGLDEFSGRILWHDVHVNWDYDTPARSMLEYIAGMGMAPLEYHCTSDPSLAINALAFHSVQQHFPADVRPLAQFHWIPPFHNPRHENTHSHLRHALLEPIREDLDTTPIIQLHPAFESLPDDLNAHDGSRYGDVLLGYLSAHAQAQVSARVREWNCQLPPASALPFPVAPPTVIFDQPHRFGIMNGGPPRTLPQSQPRLFANINRHSSPLVFPTLPRSPIPKITHRPRAFRASMNMSTPRLTLPDTHFTQNVATTPRLPLIHVQEILQANYGIAVSIADLARLVTYAIRVQLQPNPRLQAPRTPPLYLPRYEISMVNDLWWMDQNDKYASFPFRNRTPLQRLEHTAYLLLLTRIQHVARLSRTMQAEQLLPLLESS
ncbi:hypothetical protein SISNIDRAFT_486779 [Sistotremastrum niveocremeum HHB9708]|uniref:Uncharacterized protein n=1 Tax=Sistotremastrum niveocremeum HHB9708 TaxID=1314777 RepID=A0A164TC75_9AGAM|nr:hypothetical protein SISNIDRAFT_486779 [Sistotremastrum niveocremeum HHB9708]